MNPETGRKTPSPPLATDAIRHSEPPEVLFTPAWELTELFRKKQLSPVEYMTTLFRRIEEVEPSLGAFITLCPEQAMAGARDAEAALVRGEALGPLHGIPISVKDLVFTRDIRTTSGSLLYENFVPDHDAVCVERLRAAGAIIIGKTNTPEFGMNRRSINLVANEALNPWDLARTSGGSSGGAGVAVAAGMGPIGIGTDGGGSIRLPSAFNGIFGLFATRGRVPNGTGIGKSTGSPISGIGPMTRDVRDAAITLQIMSGGDTRDPWTVSSPPPENYLAGLDDGVRGLRFAWSADFGRITPRRADVVAKAQEIALSLESLGAIVDEPGFRLEDPMDMLERDPAYSTERLNERLRQIVPDFKVSFGASSFRGFDWVRAMSEEDQEKLTIYVRDRSERPTLLEYTMAIDPQVRRRPIDRLEAIFTKYDLLMSPTIAQTAFVAGEGSITPWEYTEYTYIANVSGYPAASVPAGFIDGLPVGLQLIGRPNEEALILRVARAIEQSQPWTQHIPPIAYNVGRP